MKTFLKILLIVAAVLLTLKLVPVIFGLGVSLIVIVALAAVVGLGAAGVLICIGLALVAALSPIWLPVLAIVGIVALCKKARGPTGSGDQWLRG